MNFDDQDWEDQDPPSSRDLRNHSTVWKVAAGVAVGVVLGGTLVYALDPYATPPALSQGVPSFEPMRLGTEQTADAEPKAPLQPAAQSGDAEPLRAAEAGQRAALEQAERKAAESRLRAAQEAAGRRERAWAAFYTKPPACDDNPPKATMVECANHFIRAKRQFEEMVAAGKPRPDPSPATSSGSAAAR